MRLLIILLAASVFAQQPSVRLRFGGPESAYRIQNISGATPAVVRVVNHSSGTPTHTLENGDMIYIHDVQGCSEANGYRKVRNSSPTAGTFAITDLAGSAVTCSSAFDFTWQTGWAGKVQTYLLNPSPRIFLPRSGPILERSKDPDGMGPQVAPVVTENGPAWKGLISALAAYITPGCDPLVTNPASPGFCVKAEASGASSPAEALQAAAYVWFADNSKTDYLNLARYYIYNFGRLGWTDTAGNDIPPFACDETAATCGVGSGADWISGNIVFTALGYDLIRDRLTPAERAAFANKMFNDSSDGCTNRLQKQEGSANVTADAATVTGTGFAVYASGDFVYFKTNPSYGSTGKWGKVLTVTGDTSMTVSFIAGNPASPAAAIDHYKVMPPGPNSCGAWFGAGGHSYFASPVHPRGFSTLTSVVNAVTTIFPVASTANFKGALPFYLLVDSEIVKVTAVNGLNLTVQRAQQYTAAANHSANRTVTWTSRLTGSPPSLTGPTAVTGTYTHNLTGQKTVGYLLTACALAGDDPRAASYCEKVWNYYYDLIYQSNADFWAPSNGGLTNKGYHFGRWPALHLNVGLFGRNALADSQIDILGPYFWRTMRWAYLWTPPASWRQMPIDPGLAGETYTVTNGLAYVATSAMLNPNTPETEYALYWYRELAKLNGVNAGSLAWRHYPWVAAFYPADVPARDFRPELPPWDLGMESDINPDTYTGMIVSKSGWSSTDSMIFAILGLQEPKDHMMDQGSKVIGPYTVHKGSKVLLGHNNSNGIGSGAYPSGNHFEIGVNGAFGSNTTFKSTAHPSWYTGMSDSGNWSPKIDRSLANSDYLYARGNLTLSYLASAKVTRSHRHILHLKNGPEYLIVFDDHATSEPKRFRTRQYYLTNYDPAQTFSANDDFTSIVFKKPTPNPNTAMVSTRVLYPDGAQPDATSSATTYSQQVEYDWGTRRTAAQMISVHRLAGNTTDVMPETRLLSTVTPGFAGLEIDDGDNSRVVLFSRNGEDQSTLSFGTTFEGRGKCLISGLTSGRFSVMRNGIPLYDELSAEATNGRLNGTLLFDCSGPASWSIAPVGYGMLTLSKSTLIFTARAGAALPQTQSFEATCPGMPCVTTAVITTESTWCSVPSEPVGNPRIYVVTVRSTGLPAGTYSCRIEVSAPDAVNSPVPIEVSLNISAGEQITIGSDPSSVETLYYDETSSLLLEASGGTGSYVSYTVASGELPPGISLNTDTGMLTGVPTQLGDWTFSVRVTDSNAASAEGMITVRVRPRGSGLEVSARGLATRAVLTLRYPGLDANQPCHVVIRDHTTGSLHASLTFAGGSAKRTYEVAGLSADSAYDLDAACGARSGFSTVSTRDPGTLKAVNLSLQPPAGRNAQRVFVEYGATLALGSGSSMSCSGGCTVTLPPQGWDTVLYVRHTWRDASDRNVTAPSVVQLVP